MNFIELCQEVARESGTISGVKPTSVSGQSGRLLSVVNWTSQAYGMIQRDRRDWRWLEGAFSGNTVSGTRNYLPATMGIASRFAGWHLRTDETYRSMSAYLTATGRADEQWLAFKQWMDFQPVYDFGENATKTGRPIYFTVTPNNEIALWPTPDAVYTIRGRYRKGAQILRSDADIPEMPEENHPAIVWQALILLGTYDENVNQLPNWLAFYRDQMRNLREAQLPIISLGGPLA